MQEVKQARHGERHGHHDHRSHHEHGSHHHHEGPHGHGGHRDHEGRHEHGGRRGGRARRGESKYLLMDALREGPKHGYEIIKSLEERSGGQYSPSPGVVYPTLQFLAETGMVRAEQDGDRRVFHLTEDGEREVAAHTEEVTEFWSQFTQPNAAARTEIGFVEEELESLVRTVRRGLQGDPQAASVRQIRQAVENCRNEVRRLISATEETGE